MCGIYWKEERKVARKLNSIEICLEPELDKTSETLRQTSDVAHGAINNLESLCNLFKTFAQYLLRVSNKNVY
jgi:hypothetical protein